MRAVTTPVRLSVARSPRLKPLVIALLSAFPAAGWAQIHMAPPSPAKVPVPATVGWRVYGSGPTAAPVATPNSAGGVDQVVNQSSTSAIYNWQSFDIGAASSVTFNFPGSTSSALNRVTGSASPSAIFGKLISQYANPTAGGAPLIGGSIYLINANGILFGSGAQINTGSLIASTLDLANSDYLSGLTQSIASQNPSFSTSFGLPPLVASSNVQLDPGAQITTPSGGRVFLFAKDGVQNAGTITTPGGQTVLAAGEQVYLNIPTAEPLYASEVNPAIPAVNGLLVEVGSGSGSVANLAGGVINTPTGNATLVGMAVNQSGRISATTSVSQNGSILLLARGGATGLPGNVPLKEATVGGSLTLGSGSQTVVAPDTTLGTNGQQATSSGSSTFTPSLISLSGQTIDIQANAAVVAHGGLIDARAETRPYYPSTGTGQYDYAALSGDSARLIVDAGASVDASGTTSTSVSAARNFVTTQRLGGSDLADAPLQRSGPLYQAQLTFDLRSPVPILGSTAAYANAIQKTATEQLSAGGTINLESTGAVVSNASSSLNVSGGVVNYSSAMVTPSELVASNGSVYTFNQAPANITYTGILGAPTQQTNRWGVVPSNAPSQVASGVLAPGYTAGQAGGVLSVVAPTTVLDGKIVANVTQGARQTAGLDPLASGSQLLLGARINAGNSFGSADFRSAGLGDLVIGPSVPVVNGAFWNDPLSGELPAGSRIAASTLNASGLSDITVTSMGSVSLQKGADLSLPVGASVDLAAAGANGVELGANITAAGGKISARTHQANSPGVTGTVALDAGVTLDVSGQWVNRALDGPTVQAATAGGSVSLNSGSALVLQDSSRIDVSGGGTVSAAGVVTGTAAGSISLQADRARGTDTDTPSAVHIGSKLLANSLVGGGSLTLGADSITVGSRALPGGIADGPSIGTLQLSNQFFQQGAFTSYNIDAISSLWVAPGVSLTPQAQNWLPNAAAAYQASGSHPSTFLALGTLPLAQRAPVSLSLNAESIVGDTYGALTLSAGSSIRTDPLAAVSLHAGVDLTVQGQVVAPGGKISVALVSPVAPASGSVAGTLLLGSQGSIDVSGTAVVQPQTGPLPVGTVVPGGTVSFGVSTGASLTQLDIAPGATIAADGASAKLGQTTTTPQGSTSLALQTVASPGGTISFAPSDGGALLAGNMHALGGDSSVSGGSFALQFSSQQPTSIVVQQAPITGATSTAPGVVSVSAQTLGQGFGSASLQASQQVRFLGDVSLDMPVSLTVDAPVLAASPQSSSVSLSGASTLQVGASLQQVPTAAAPSGGKAALNLSGGLVELFGQQVLQGIGNLAATASSELRLESVAATGGTAQGDLATRASVTLSAPQIVPTTNTNYTIDAGGQRVLLTGGNSSAQVPLVAVGSVTINAADITTVDPANPTQYAVLRAPFGSLALNATDSIEIGSSSVLSVSGAGLTVPYGQTSGGSNWSYAGSPVNAPPVKSIRLNAGGQSIDAAAGASFDLSGGGNLLAEDFVPGNGGSKNVFAGAAGGAFAIVPTAGAYAPQDTDILTQQKDAGGNNPSLQLGRSVVFGAGGPIPAGTYAVLPAEYATLAGAYLVTPANTSAPLALGAALTQTDGSVLVGGRYVQAGTSFGSAQTQTFKVLTAAQAATYSEVDQANANTYFTAQANAAGVPVPPLPTDAGVLGIAAGQLRLNASTLFTLPTVTTGTGTAATTTTVGRGGELDIAANSIQVGGSAGAGTLELDPAELNATGANRIVLGGSANSATGQLSVTASNLSLENAGTPLAINDLVLVANNAITLAPGVSIAAPSAATASGGLAPAPALSLAGDGALLRVSTDPGASTSRTGAQGLAGALNIGSGASLSGGAITAEGTLSNLIASDAELAGQSITLGAGHIAVGAAGSGASPGTLVLTPTLAAQVSGAQSLKLRSAVGIDLNGSVTLGGANVNALTLDTPQLTVQGSGASATIEAGGVTLTNSTGGSGLAATGSNQLQITALATTAAAGTGQVVIGPGAVAVSGTSQTGISAAHEVVLGDTAGLATAGALSIGAASLQAANQATAALTAGGAFSLNASGTPSGASPGAGAQVSIAAASINQAGQMILPSGVLQLTASGGSSDAVHFASGSSTDLSGRSSTIDSVSISTPGGMMNVKVPNGGVVLDQNASVNVSAPSSAGSAGSITISAPAGTVALQGSLQGNAAAGQTSGQLSIDSANAIDLTGLSRMIGALPNNFAQSISLRNRSGDQQLATGTRLTAQNISLSADQGVLTVAGDLTAAGGSDPRIAVSGGQGLVLAAGSTIAAHASGVVNSENVSGSAGGEVQLSSGNLQLQAGGTYAANAGAVSFDGGVIDTTAAPGGSNGGVLVIAPRTGSGTDLQVGGTGGTHIVGASSVEIEALKHYNATTVNTTLIGQVTADNQTLGGTGGANAARVVSRVGALLGQPSGALQLRAGVEIDSAGDLNMVGNAAQGGWNLTAFAANGKAQAQATGAPMDLSLRAAGNLNITGSISDGFLPSGTPPTTAAKAAVITPAAAVAQFNGSYGPGSNITLIGGADLGAADRAGTIAGAGNVNIGAAGKSVLVRTTTGDIAIAAGQDVTMANTLADVYTTGTPVLAATLAADGYVGNQLSSTAYIRSGTSNQSPFLSGGGNLSIQAGRDIVGAPNAATAQLFDTAWAYRAIDQRVGGQPVWWNRYDLFQQGYGSFGGGNIVAVAGRDIASAGFESAASGYVARNAAGGAVGVVEYQGGDVRVQAGRDLVGSTIMATGGVANISAGRDITKGGTSNGLQLLYGSTALNVTALDGNEIGLVSSFGMVPSYTGPGVGSFTTGLSVGATLQAQAAAGDLKYDSSSPFDAPPGSGQPASLTPDRIIPDVSSFVAPNGSISAGILIQNPVGTTSLNVLAQNNLSLSGVTVNGTVPNANLPAPLANANADALNPLLTYTPGLTPYDDGVRSPMRLVAQNGDLDLSVGLLTTTEVRMIAGRDIVMATSPNSANPFNSINIQQQASGEASLVQAGRDILFTGDSTATNRGALLLSGPGELFITAGRNIDLSTSDGVLAAGNRNNPLLPSASGAITIAAGTSFQAGDYTQAVSWYFPVLGGTGIAGNAADLAAQLAAYQAGQALPSLGSAAAAQYASEPVSAQIAQVQTLVGSAGFNAAVLADAQRRANGGSVTLTNALSQFETLSASDQQPVLAAALATAWSASIPLAQQQQVVLSIAQSSKSAYLSQLQQFVVTQGAPAGISAAQALAAFEALPPERQAVFTNQVLVDVIRQSGRTAAALSGSAQASAYAPAYAALDLVFPAAGGSGNLEMGYSQVETQQNSDITILSPRGNVDVGTLVPVTGQAVKGANQLGVITADGGNISVVVRDSVNVDQSRVVTVGLGDLLMWASTGSLDAGRGGKTVVGAPAPVYYLNAQGQFVVDTTGSFSGSGIAVLNQDSSLDLYAPKGAIDAGDAGIRSLGNAYLGAAQFVNALNFSISGVSVGGPPPVSTGGLTAGLAGASQATAASNTRIDAGDSEDEKERKRRRRLNLVLDFLGFGDGSTKP